MGLTGAGGALITIPLLMQFQGMSLKDASVYSLLTVMIAATSNFFFQRKDAEIKLAAFFVVAATIGSFASYPFKSALPDFGIAIIIALVAVYSLYKIWSAKETALLDEHQEPHWWKTATIGLGIGVLTTFTGLGGGVLMLPVLLGFYRLPQKQAVATSLVVVGLSSLASFLIQMSKSEGLGMDLKILGLVVSILMTSYVLRFAISKISIKTADIIRKVVFTLVVIIALAKIF